MQKTNQNNILINESLNRNKNLFNDHQQKFNFTFAKKPIEKYEQIKKSNNIAEDTFKNVFIKLEPDSSTETSGSIISILFK